MLWFYLGHVVVVLPCICCVTHSLCTICSLPGQALSTSGFPFASSKQAAPCAVSHHSALKWRQEGRFGGYRWRLQGGSPPTSSGGHAQKLPENNAHTIASSLLPATTGYPRTLAPCPRHKLRAISGCTRKELSIPSQLAGCTAGSSQTWSPALACCRHASRIKHRMTIYAYTSHKFGPIADMS
jgi:hypothetical protein